MTRPFVPEIPAQKNRLTASTLVRRALFVVVAALLIIPPLPMLPRFEGTATEPASLGFQSGVRILRVSGASYQVGYQHGVLLREDLRALLRDQLFSKVVWEDQASHSLILAYARRVDPHLPTALRQEIRGIADGAGLPYHELLAWNLLASFLADRETGNGVRQVIGGRQWSLLPPESPVLDSFRPPLAKGLPEVAGLHHLSLRRRSRPTQVSDPSTLPRARPLPGGPGFAAWGAVMADRELRLAQLLPADGAGPYGAEPIIVIAHPATGTPFFSITWPGVVGTVAGFNQAKLALTVTGVSTPDVTADGVPATFLARQVLQYATDEETSLTLLIATPRTGGAVIMLGDGKVPHAQRVEVSAYHYAVQENEGGFLFDPPTFILQGELASEFRDDGSDSRPFPRDTVEQQLRMGRDPRTTTLQALQHAAQGGTAEWLILLEPASQIAMVQQDNKPAQTLALQE